jgi:hypothetical protein
MSSTASDHPNKGDPQFTSVQFLKTGISRCSDPAFFGDTPPTKLVPYSIDCLLWKVPCLPVKPWQMTLVSLFIFKLSLVAV